MTVVYPAVFKPLKEGGYMVYLPDWENNTQGEDLADAIAMARDAIGILCIVREEDGEPLPTPSLSIQHEAGEIVSFVDVDLTAYRRSLEKSSQSVSA